MTVRSISDALIKVRLVFGGTAFKRRGWNVGRFHIDADRTGLFETPLPPRRSKDDDGEPEPPQPPVELWSGLPVLLRCVCPAGRPAGEEAAPSDIRYLLERRYPDGEVIEAEWWSHNEIRKGHHLSRQMAPLAGRREIDDDARIIFAQRTAFGIQVEYPARHSGLSARLESGAYVLHDARQMLSAGRTEPGSIVGQDMLLQPRRAETWAKRRTLPMPPPTEAAAEAAIRALATFDPKGRAFCAAVLGARALFYSLRPMSVTCLLTGLRGTGKTAIGQILHWAEGPCAAADEPDMSFRTTALGFELMTDRKRDCAFLVDDGERVRPEASAPLKPEIVGMISSRTREAFDGAPAKIRGSRALALAETRRIHQLLAFSAETALGLEPSVLARSVWWSFERGEIAQEPMLSATFEETPTWAATSDVFSGCGHAAIGLVLDRWAAHGRPAAVDWIRQIDREAGDLALAADLAGENEDRARVRRGLAMIIAGAMLCDAAAGTENLFRDAAMAFGAPLAAAQLERLASGTTATVGFDRAWFSDAFSDLVASGDQLWFDATTGRPLGEGGGREESRLVGLGYQHRGGEWQPVARMRGGWITETAYWAEPGALHTWLDRRAVKSGGTFPFNRKTLPGYLVKIGLAQAAPDGRNTHKPWIPGSGGAERVIVIGHESLKTPNPSPQDSPLPPMGRETGREITETIQDITTILPTSPQIPTQVARTPWPDRTAVIDADCMWTIGPDGEATGEKIAETANLGELAARAIERQITQLWVHPSLTEPLGLPQANPTQAREGLLHPFGEASGLPDGWNLGAPGRIRAWNRASMGPQALQIVLSAYDGETWPFGRAVNGRGQLAALEAFRASTGGFRPRIAPPVTFETILRSLHKGGTDLSASIATFPAPLLAETVDPVWLAQAGAGAFVVAADKSAAYLAAMASLAVGFGEPSYRAGGSFDGRLAGSWRATVTMPDGWPDPFPPLGKAKGEWFASPSLALAAQAGARIEVHEAWLFPATHRPFEPVYKRLKAARATLQAQGGEAAGLALEAVKSLYARGTGNLASRVKRQSETANDLHRPDWRQAIMAMCRANIIRNLQSAGLRPFGLQTDAIYFMADSPDLAATRLKRGTEPGSWRPMGSMPAAALPDAYRQPTPARSAAPRLIALGKLLASRGD